MTEITSEAELELLYDAPVPTSILKEIDHITDDYRKLIEASPFAILDIRPGGARLLAAR